jgi:hypothetical protein
LTVVIAVASAAVPVAARKLRRVEWFFMGCSFFIHYLLSQAHIASSGAVLDWRE